MANKLTKEKIDLLIEQVLSEDKNLNLYKYKKGDESQFLKIKDAEQILKGGEGYHDQKIVILKNILSAYGLGTADQDTTDYRPQNIKNFIKNYGDLLGFPINPDKDSVTKRIYSDPLRKVSPFDQIKLDDLEKQAAPNDLLSKADFEKVLGDPKNPLHYEVVELLDNMITLSKQGDIKSPWAENILDFAPKLLSKVKTEDPKNLQIGGDSPLPQIKTSSRYATKVGFTTPPLLTKVFTNFLGGINSGLKVRLEKIAEAAKVLANPPSGGQAPDIYESLSNAIVINYLRDIVQNYESSVSGFLFENFLALLLSGTKEGGNLKIEDFLYTDGNKGITKGSAKLYRQDAKEFGGSLKLFYNLCKEATVSGKPETITYVIAIKGMDLDKIAVYTVRYSVTPLLEVNPDEPAPSFGEGYIIKKFQISISSSAEKAVSVDGPNTKTIFVKIPADGKKPKFYVDYEPATVGNDEEPAKKERYKTAFQQEMKPENHPLKTREFLGNPVATINLAAFAEQPEKFNKLTEDYLNRSLKGVAEMNKNINNFTINITDYLTDQKKGERPSFKKAEKALENFYQLRKNSYEVLAATDESLPVKQMDAPHGGYSTPPDYNPGTTITDKAKLKIKGQISETKSLKELDKLIERVILNKMNKL